MPAWRPVQAGLEPASRVCVTQARAHTHTHTGTCGAGAGRFRRARAALPLGRRQLPVGPAPGSCVRACLAGCMLLAAASGCQAPVALANLRALVRCHKQRGASATRSRWRRPVAPLTSGAQIRRRAANVRREQCCAAPDSKIGARCSSALAAHPRARDPKWLSERVPRRGSASHETRCSWLAGWVGDATHIQGQLGPAGRDVGKTHNARAGSTGALTCVHLWAAHPGPLRPPPGLGGQPARTDAH